MSTHADYLLWFDAETTGLEPDADVLEVAAFATATVAPFDRVDSTGFHAYVQAVKAPRVDQFVVDMHTRNGLWLALLNEPRLPLDEVDRQLVEYLRTVEPGATFALAGAGVAVFDRPMVDRLLPQTAVRLTYWTFDVSVMRRFAKACGRDVERPESNHRAADDIHDAVELARRLAGMAGSRSTFACAVCLRRIAMGSPMEQIAAHRVRHYPACPELVSADPPLPSLSEGWS